jgi:hypothetical protein
VNNGCLASFGGLTITGGACTAACNTQIPVTYTIDSNAAVINYTIAVRATTGAGGSTFYPAPNGASQTQSNTQTFQVQAVVITPQLTADGAILNAGQCAYISGSPVMPALTARLVASNGQPVSGTASWRLRIVFDQEYQNCPTCPRQIIATYTTSLPFSGAAIMPASQTWNISPEFGEPGVLIRGGQATLEWSLDGGATQQYGFCIRGTNPSETTIEAFLTAFVAPWFLKNIFYHETLMSQFCEPVRMQVLYCAPSNNHWGRPIFGYPGGYGLGQLDPPPGLDAIWSWKSNAAASIAPVEAKAGPPVYTTNDDPRAYPFWMRQIRDWSLFNQAFPGEAIPPPAPDWNPTSPSIQPQCQFVFAEAPITNQPGTYWFGDAVLMKQYAGAPVNYISWDNVSVPAQPRWVINRANASDPNVVGEFCTCETRNTCLTDVP